MKRTDTFTPAARSRIMAKVKSAHNRSTEKIVRASLVARGARGWRMHARDLPGRPDFVFDREKVAVFVDGCFWHGCPRCYRRPQSSRAYWDAKIAANKRRDRLAAARLRRMGWSAIRIWEHSLKDLAAAMARIMRKIDARSESKIKARRAARRRGFAKKPETAASRFC